MRSGLRAKFCTLIILLLLAAFPVQAGDTLFQYSTIDALMAGLYDGGLSVAELKKRGNFGLGTFNDLDGEMVVLDGQVCQVKSDGKVHLAGDALKTPFAAVTVFTPELSQVINKAGSLKELTELLDKALPSSNLFYAVKIQGRFPQMTVRSVPRQVRPYPPLAQAVEKQTVFPLKEVEGTLVGLRCPAYARNINVPGYHFHFLTQDRTQGGHVLDCALENLTAQIDVIHGFSMILPKDQEFYQVDLSGEKGKELEKVEKRK